ncbi:MAG: M36 family metallopeptidase, partial [Pyrinomonadaceae bacterium]|nr:M36 family metallopeptidase [Pyrinomonadaceae bacterium]
MKISTNTETRYRVMFSLVVLGLMAAVIILSNQFHSKAGNAGQDVSDRTVSQVKNLENYDIRTDKNQAETLNNFRRTAGRDAVSVADARDKFVAGETSLRQTVPTLKVEYNEDIRTPEVIAPDVDRGRAFLTAPSTAKHSDILRRFAADNGTLIGLKAGQAAQLKVTADYTNPDGNLSYAHLEQFINDVPVFRGEIKAGFTKNGEMMRVINNLAPDLDYASLSTDFGNPLDAVRAASGNLNFELPAADLIRNEANSTDLKAVFGTGDFATTAEKMYFPTEPGVARTAWRMAIWEPVNAYYVIVDAESGTILWRKNISEDQTQSATYNVYNNPLSMMNVAESPAPTTPGPTNPSTGTQGAQITRNSVTLIGNEGDLSFNNLGWITDNANGVNGWTDGNAVEAGLDIVAPNGVDAPTSGTNRVFDFNYNPAPGLPPPPDDLTTPTFRNGAVTQLFYINNRYHDELYKLGFTEAARNFQNDNFGRGGVAADRISAEAQDSSGTNNANFATPADGGRGRMQMYRFTQIPGRDGDLDADIVVHEFTHGLSNRLVGNASGLSTARARGMGEG